MKHDAILYRSNKWDTYFFNEMGVPRVSEILKQCIGKDYLLKWAANLGKRYYQESSHTLYIGTLVHELIEHFLIFGTRKDIFFKSNIVESKVNKAYENFLNWYNNKIEQGFKIQALEIEKQTSNPWYGGTIDCIMQLECDSVCKKYIVDFKTSKQISMEYIIQTYAYYWSENWNCLDTFQTTSSIDGIGIIRIDKEKDIYEDLFIDFNNPDNYCFLRDIDYSLKSIVDWFYQSYILDYNLRQMKYLNKKGGLQNGFNKRNNIYIE